MTLHWLIALAIFGLIAAGVWMTDAIREPATQMQAYKIYQLHKSLGLTVLVLSVLRLLWRLLRGAPLLPAGMKPWERMLAKFSHWAFYALMIGVPLIGWAMVSASPLGLPTIVFGLFEWPHIAPLANAENKAALEGVFKEAHEIAALGMGALALLHVAAALKHHFVDRDTVLLRMLPVSRRHLEGRGV
jgi:cytochrome b561